MKGGRREEGERVCRCDTDMLSRCHPEEALSINFSLSLSPPNPEMLRSYALFRSEYQSFFKKKIASQIHHKNNKQQFFFTELKKGNPYLQCTKFYFIHTYIEGGNNYSDLFR